jgi:ABC-type ATPase involved in cell division
VKKKNIFLHCKFQQENWEFLQREADRMECSISAVLRQIIGIVFENRQYLQEMFVYDAVEKNKKTIFKKTNLTVTNNSFDKLNQIIYERNINNCHVTSIYYADYVVSAYISLIEADIIKK